MIKPQIDKNVTVWPQERKRASKFAWLAEVEVGDSFVLSNADAARIMSATITGKRGGWLPETYSIARRKESDTQVRVWRMA